MSLPGQQPPMHVLLASPRGFCAGVDRAIQIVEQAIEQHGAPVYVRHEIVHNRSERAQNFGHPPTSVLPQDSDLVSLQ